jgi:hypothetical protein
MQDKFFPQGTSHLIEKKSYTHAKSKCIMYRVEKNNIDVALRGVAS